jgi:hypothetical protein
MNIQILPNGNLKMKIGSLVEKGDISRMKFKQSQNTENRFVKRFLRQYGYKLIKPENCDALTSATIITDGKDVWADMQYQIQSFIEELLKGNEVIWYKG